MKCLYCYYFTMPNAQCTRNDAIRGMHGCFRKLNPHVQDGDDESYGGSSGSFSKVCSNVVLSGGQEQ
jgi:hypothetical protein